MSNENGATFIPPLKEIELDEEPDRAFQEAIEIPSSNAVCNQSSATDLCHRADLFDDKHEQNIQLENKAIEESDTPQCPYYRQHHQNHKETKKPVLPICKL